MLELFQKGGPIMWPLLVVSIVTFAVILERIVFLLRSGSARKKDAVRQLIAHGESGELEAAIRIGSHSTDAIAQILAEGLLHADDCFEETISCAAEAELDRYEQGVPLLDTVVTLAPLLGLLGTVTGMIRSFGLLGANELDAPVAITGGIAEALIATAFGLTLAISALLPLNILTTRKERVRREIEDAATRLEIALKSRTDRTSQRARAA